MPTEDDINELLDNCTREWTTLNGASGYKFTGPNGNSIFLPAAGYRFEGDLDSPGIDGYYWSSTQHPSYSDNAYGLYFGSDRAYLGHGYRNNGQSVRPVEKPTASNVPAEAIDLGLPSGIKWASCNVGASKPEEYGGYYAWGETEEKETYDWSVYIHCDGSYETCHDLGSDISGTEYDIAQVKWGGNWCVPTLDDIKELLENCTSEWTTLNGVNGRKFTGPNGNSIFLPAAGFRWDSGLSYAREFGYYWSSTQDPSYSTFACCLYFGSGDPDWDIYTRYFGLSVRPVARN
jgi:hypothetical protein